MLIAAVSVGVLIVSLVVLAFSAAVIYSIWPKAPSSDIKPHEPGYDDTDTEDEPISPLFSNGHAKRPLAKLTLGEQVWAITTDNESHQMVVDRICRDAATLLSADGVAEAQFFPDYFTEQQAARLKIARGAWCLTRFKQKRSVQPYRAGDPTPYEVVSAPKLFQGDEALDLLQQLLFWDLTQTNSMDSAPQEPEHHCCGGGACEQATTPCAEDPNQVAPCAEDPNQPIPETTSDVSLWTNQNETPVTAPVESAPDVSGSDYSSPSPDYSPDYSSPSSDYSSPVDSGGSDYSSDYGGSDSGGCDAGGGGCGGD